MRDSIIKSSYSSFSEENLESGYAYLEKMSPPYVLKADGLAAGKGVLILDDLNQAKTELRKMVAEKKFGEASNQVVVEQFLKGIELSCFVITDGDSYKILPTAKDYKRIGEGDKGLNTGGMGAISPPPFVDKIFMEKVETKIIKPTIEGLKKDQIPYQGFIFIGLIKVKNEPFVIEYNVRMGDPETEVVFPRIQNDILEVFMSLHNKTLLDQHLLIDNKTAVTIVLVSGGYPENYEKGHEIIGLGKIDSSIIFHAGAITKNRKVVTSGGRVLAVTSLSKNYKDALSISYKNISKIYFKNMYYRKDIGFDL